MIAVKRTKAKHKVAYDTEGGRISFEEISTGTHRVYTAEVNNMIQRELPVGQLFSTFGKSAIIKTEFVAAQNFCRLSILEVSGYSCEGGNVITYGDRSTCKVITYEDMNRVIDTYPTGECVDAVLCASYKCEAELTLAPYVYDWKSLPVIPKIMRAMLIVLLLAVVVYVVKDTTVKDFLFLAFMLVKDNLVPLASACIIW